MNLPIPGVQWLVSSLPSPCFLPRLSLPLPASLSFLPRYSLCITSSRRREWPPRGVTTNTYASRCFRHYKPTLVSSLLPLLHFLLDTATPLTHSLRLACTDTLTAPSPFCRPPCRSWCHRLGVVSVFVSALTTKGEGRKEERMESSHVMYPLVIITSIPANVDIVMVEEIFCVFLIDRNPFLSVNRIAWLPV